MKGSLHSPAAGFSQRRRLTLATIALIALTVFPSHSASPDGVTLVPIAGIREFPDATAPEAIRYACSQDSTVLAAYFAEQKVPFEQSLIRGKPGFRSCHIYYEPTLPGFRASPDNREVRELYAAPDPLNFLTGRKPMGDSLDVIKSVLSQLPRPVDVSLIMAEDFAPKHWPQGLERHFAGTPHRIRLVGIEADKNHPWAQDYFKAGEVDGRLRILIPRRLFEGRGEDGEFFGSVLDVFGGEPFARSKLSWEGGDLQFVADPRNPERLLLFFGGAAWDYWGKDLDAAEYAYILRLEFGADQAVNLSLIGPHTDFLVSFLPEKGIALVARPERENFRIARAAAAELQRLYGKRTPGLQSLIRFFNDPVDNLVDNPQFVPRQLEVLRAKLPQITPQDDEQLNADFDTYIEQHCPDDPEVCFQLQGRRKMFDVAPDLLRRASEAGAFFRERAGLTERLLSLIDSQLPDAPLWNRALLDEKAREIRKLGFRVVRVPHLVAPDLTNRWPGISYVNLLAFDRKLFVPAFGLGKAEERIFDDLQKKLKPRYEVIPVYARSSLLLNGGVHCAFGIVREVGGPPLPRLTEAPRKDFNLLPAPFAAPPARSRLPGI